MNTLPGNTIVNPATEQEFPIPGNGADPDNTVTPEDGERSNLDDAIDDDNENPVSQTLIGAAENSGPESIDDARELDGEVDEDGQ